MFIYINIFIDIYLICAQVEEKYSLAIDSKDGVATDGGHADKNKIGIHMYRLCIFYCYCYLYFYLLSHHKYYSTFLESVVLL